MLDKYSLSVQEGKKIEFRDFIENLFSEFNELYVLNISFYQSTIFEKGKSISSQPCVKILPSFKYDSFYCAWFPSGVKICQKKEDLFTLATNEPLVPLLDNTPINFYLKKSDKNITYKEFEKNFLNRTEWNNEVLNLFNTTEKSINFCRDSLQKDIDLFLGKTLICKEIAKELQKSLPHNQTASEYIKI